MRGAMHRNPFSYEQLADGISSSSVVGEPEREIRDFHRDIHKDFHSPAAKEKPPTPSSSGQMPNRPPNPFAEARYRQQLLRAERDEAVRRELAVGTGPEVRRP
jgi:hypothetical protein